MITRLKKRIAGVLISTMVLAAAVPAMAAVATVTKDAEVTFSEPSDALEFDPSGMPPGFKFGSRTIDLNDQYYPEVTTGTPLKLVVKDIRGTAPGWNLTAQLANFVNGGHTMSGAEITLRSGTGATVGTITHTKNPGLTPSATMPNSGTVTMKGGDVAVKVLEAAAGAGRGLTTLEFPIDSAASTTVNTLPTSTVAIELKVVGASALAGTYTASIDWILHNTP